MLEPSDMSSVSWLLTSDTVPVTLPVRLPSKVDATKVSEPIVHLSVDSFQIKVLLVSSPLSISIPAFSEALPVALLLRSITLSARFLV